MKYFLHHKRSERRAHRPAYNSNLTSTHQNAVELCVIAGPSRNGLIITAPVLPGSRRHTGGTSAVASRFCRRASCGSAAEREHGWGGRVLSLRTEKASTFKCVPQYRQKTGLKRPGE